jgi:glycosyltransferase involved in cell wall biosynthesis
MSPLGQVPLYASQRGLPTRPFLHIPNGVDTSAFDATSATRIGHLKYGYFGSHGNTDHLETLVEALAHPSARARAGDFSVHFYGWGPRKGELEVLARRLEVGNLHFHAPVDRNELPAVMSTMDAFLFPLHDTNGLYRFGASPNKLQDYMAAGRPILMNAPFDDNPIRASGGGGILVSECTPEAWAAAYLELLDAPNEERSSMGRSLRALAEQRYDFAILGSRLDSELRDIAGIAS